MTTLRFETVMTLPEMKAYGLELMEETHTDPQVQLVAGLRADRDAPWQVFSWPWPTVDEATMARLDSLHARHAAAIREGAPLPWFVEGSNEAVIYIRAEPPGVILNEETVRGHNPHGKCRHEIESLTSPRDTATMITPDRLSAHAAWVVGRGGIRLVLIGANLDGFRLSGANLAGAVLRQCSMVETDLQAACLVGAVLCGTDLSRANLAGANLAGANLAWATLIGANLSRTYLASDVALTPPSLVEIVAAGLEPDEEGRVWGWRTGKSMHMPGQAYVSGCEYVAPVFSADEHMPCHPGLYLASAAWLQREYGEVDVVRCFCRLDELVHASPKWRAKRLWIVGHAAEPAKGGEG